MSPAAGAARAGFRASIGIDAEFRALGVDVMGEGLDAGGESFCVGDDVAGGIAADLPAIVNDDVFVAGVLHAAADESVGGGLDEILGDVASEAIPTVPAHGRSESRAVFEGANWPNGTQKREKQEKDQRAQFSQASIHNFSPAPIVFL